MDKARRLTNCLLVALTLWFATRGRGWIGVRRSLGLAGLIPHFVHGREKQSGRILVIVEAIPPKRKDVPWSHGDSFLLFPALYRARRYRLVATGTGDTLRDAVRQMWSRDVCRWCGRMP